MSLCLRVSQRKGPRITPTSYLMGSSRVKCNQEKALERQEIVDTIVSALKLLQTSGYGS